MIVNLALMLTLLLVIGFAAQWLAWRVKLPAILFLLLAGILLGPVSGLVEPDKLLGKWLFPAVSLAVALILFEGSMTLRFHELRGIGRAVRGLVSYGAVTALLMLAAAAHWIAGLDWPIAFLFGALGCVTGPTVIVPMLRTLRPDAKIANTLRWEGIVIDPLGALFAVLVFEAIVSREQGHSLGVFAATIGSGVVIGVVGAIVLAFLLRRHLIPEYLQNFGTMAAVLGAFSASNAITHESGLLAVTIMGIVIGNRRDVHIDHIMDFKEDLSTLLVSMLFVILAARLKWPLPDGMLLGGALVFLAAQFVVRPVSTWLATLGSTLNWRQRALIAWVAPRGIVAAAVSALFALRLEELKVPGAEGLVPLVFSLIIGTVILQSATSRQFARWLRVAEPEPDGVLVFGADPVARAVAAALAAADFRVLVVDDDWDGIRAARMQGLETFFGSPTSQHADHHMDLTGIGRLLAMSTRRELNSLAVVHYRQEFGRERVYRLRNLAPEERHDRRNFAGNLLAPALFGEDMTHARFAEMMSEGWRIKSTKLTETFDWPHFVEQYGSGSVLLFGIGERGVLRVVSSKRELDPKPGWTVIVLVPPRQDEEEAGT
ncbi:sodium:proton antiporter [Oleiagrimonas citrea]|uniref:Sodium:proton antiporter n=2 Tax=Oleiagrimonas citrea TaxID=1665687 RepID=A0A846ZR46_9GAMM|nr:sodium:proton antiporter [Oleiagrimonas citrea]